MAGCKTLVTIAAFLLFAAPSTRAQDAWVGTWKVNLEKSTYPAGPPAFKRMILRIAPKDDQLRITYDIVGSRGGVTHIDWIGKPDGRDYLVAGIDGYVVTHAYRRVDEHTYEVVQKTEGSVSMTARMTISPDGKTLTTYTPGRLVTVTVYDRQSTNP